MPLAQPLPAQKAIIFIVDRQRLARLGKARSSLQCSRRLHARPRKSHHVVHRGTNADPLSCLVIMVTEHMGQQKFAGWQLECVQKLIATKRVTDNFRLDVCVIVMHDVVGAQQHIDCANGQPHQHRGADVVQLADWRDDMFMYAVGIGMELDHGFEKHAMARAVSP